MVELDGDSGISLLSGFSILSCSVCEAREVSVGVVSTGRRAVFSPVRQGLPNAALTVSCGNLSSPKIVRLRLRVSIRACNSLFAGFLRASEEGCPLLHFGACAWT